MTLNPVVIGGAYSPRNLRSPYAETAESLDASIHAVALNRSEIQRKCLGVPENRSERGFQTAEAALATPPSYDVLTRAGS